MMLMLRNMMAILPGRSQYFAFSLDDSGLREPVTRNYTPLVLDRFSTYIFFYSILIDVLSLVTKIYDWMKKALYTVYIDCQIDDISRCIKKTADVFKQKNITLLQ